MNGLIYEECKKEFKGSPVNGNVSTYTIEFGDAGEGG